MARSCHEVQKATKDLIASGNPFFIVFNPKSEKAPTLAYPNIDEAWEAAEFLAKRENDEPFFVLEAKGSAFIQTPVPVRKEIVGPLNGRELGAHLRRTIKIGDTVSAIPNHKPGRYTGVVTLIDMRETTYGMTLMVDNFWCLDESIRLVVPAAPKRSHKKKPVIEVGDTIRGTRYDGSVVEGVCTNITLENKVQTYELGYGRWTSETSTVLVKKRG